MLHLPAAQACLAIAIPAASAGQRLWGLMGWVLLVIVVAVVLVLLVLWFRKWLLGQPDRLPREGVGFTLHDLRRLRDAGQISAEEYERARDKLVATSHTKGARAVEGGEAARDTVKDVDVIRPKE